MSVPFRIRYCRCGTSIPLAQDIYELDAEWQRRFPDMVGALACHPCALRTYWRCAGRDGAYVDGHLPAGLSTRCFDSWNHVSSPGTHRRMAVSSPHSGLLQRAEAYLRSAAARKSAHPEIAAMLRTVIQEWDEQRSTTGTSQTTVWANSG
ncbi:hypothetical protein ACIRFF_27700 [Streptomyces cyaneofuscatus]